MKGKLAAVRKVAASAIVAAGLTAASVQAWASPVLFDLSGAFASGSTLSGTLTIDTATGVATAVHAIISAPASLDFTVIEAQGLVLPGVYQIQIGDGLLGSLPDLNIGLFVGAATDLTGYAGGGLVPGSNIFYGPGNGDRVVQGAVTVQQVPEPATLALFAFGLAGLGWRVRKGS